MQRWRSVLSVVALVLAVVTGTVGAVAAHARDVVVDGQEFSRRVVGALERPAVREVVAGRVVDQIVDRVPETLAVRPAVDAAVRGALGSAAFQGILTAAVADLHRTFLADDDGSVSLRLLDLALVAEVQLATASPQVAERIPDDLTDAVVDVSAGNATLDTSRWFARTRLLAFLAPAVTVLLLLAGVALARDRRRALVGAGAAVAAAGLLLVVVERLGRRALTSSVSDPDTRVVATAVWRSLTTGITTTATTLGVVGALLAVVAVASGRGRSVPAMLADAATAVRLPTTTAATWWWTIAAIAGGVLLLVDGPLVLRAIGLAAGVVLVGGGVSQALELLAPAGARSRTGSSRRVRWVTAGAVVALVATGAGVAIARSGGTPEAAPMVDDPGCNGSVLLCDRPFDEVIFPATHNSMSSAADGFLGANHPRGIIPQLDAGYRGLLIDVYFGLDDPSGPVVITDRAPLDEAERAELVTELGESTVRAAEQVRRRVEGRGGERATYLCHGYCEAGATPLEPQLVEIARWLRAHPREVLVIFIEDSIPPADLVAAFEHAGLDDLAYTHGAGQPWPTLGEMIDADQRVFVMSENRSGGASWYQDGFALTQETPYSFRSVDRFSCEANRGRADSPLFLVNHFVTPPSVTAAAEANAAPVVAARLEQCQRERGAIPNLVAVDFYDRGDVVAVVADLNDGRTP